MEIEGKEINDNSNSSDSFDFRDLESRVFKNGGCLQDYFDFESYKLRLRNECDRELLELEESSNNKNEEHTEGATIAQSALEGYGNKYLVFEEDKCIFDNDEAVHESASLIKTETSELLVGSCSSDISSSPNNVAHDKAIGTSKMEASELPVDSGVHNLSGSSKRNLDSTKAEDDAFNLHEGEACSSSRKKQKGCNEGEACSSSIKKQKGCNEGEACSSNMKKQKGCHDGLRSGRNPTVKKISKVKSTQAAKSSKVSRTSLPRI